MKNKYFFLAVCIIAALVLFAGCEDVQKIEPQYKKAAKVDASSITVTVTSDNPTEYIIGWNTVANATSYYLYARQEGKMSTFDLYNDFNCIIYFPSNLYSYNADGTRIDNTDLDKWAALIHLSQELPPNRYNIGIQTRPIQGGNTRPSDIVWSTAVITVE